MKIILTVGTYGHPTVQIEMVLNQMKRHVAKIDPKTKDDLIETITAFWCEKMTVQQCNLYIDHIYKVIPVCVAMNGAATVIFQTKYSKKGREEDHWHISTRS